MDENRPGYYAVIPADVRYDDRIAPNAKLLYGEISALIGSEGYCFASNQYFADLYGCTVKSISRLVSSLTEQGYISIVLEKDAAGQVKRRKIYLKVSIPEIQPVDKIVHTPGQFCGEGMDKIVQDINLSNTNILKENKKEKKTIDPLPVFVDWIRTTFPNADPGKMNLLYKHLVSYKEMRADSKSPLNTKRKVDGMLADLLDGSGGDLDTMCEMLKISTRRCWLSVHPPGGQKFAPPPQHNEREYKCV